MFPWHVAMVPRFIQVDGEEVPHPARTNAVFVVHGIGTQTLAETGGLLRSGFEDALVPIQEWQHANHVESPLTRDGIVPPPHIQEGYWADYANLESTFPTDWKKFEEEWREFFSMLWKKRSLSLPRTFLWFFEQQLRLLSFRVIKEVGFAAWLLYIPLQLVSLTMLVCLLIFYPRIISGYLADVRLYLDPKGITEDAIVQRIDQRVGEMFMRMIGLDREFRPLPTSRLISIQGIPFTFTRVIWVAHSLGTVISYNVLSDLFRRAEELNVSGDARQKKGVTIFREGLRRLVTLGSPLDKAAFLFGRRAIRPWPEGEREAFLHGGETLRTGGEVPVREWWINFYHVLDPVSGALSHPLICGKNPPQNYHIGLLKVPGLAHLAYWSDVSMLRYVLARLYGKEFMPDKDYRPMPARVLTIVSAAGYIVWAVIIFAFAYALVSLVSEAIRLFF
jgi:hypothetical protein